MMCFASILICVLLSGIPSQANVNHIGLQATEHSTPMAVEIDIATPAEGDQTNIAVVTLRNESTAEVTELKLEMSAGDKRIVERSVGVLRPEQTWGDRFVISS